MRTSTRHFDPMSANEKFEPIFPCRFRYLVLRTHCQQLDLNWDVEPIYNKGRCVELWMMMARPIIHDEPFRRRHPFSLQLISQVEFFDTKETSWLMNGQHSATRFVRTNLSVFSVLQVLKYLSNEQSRKKRTESFACPSQRPSAYTSYADSGEGRRQLTVRDHQPPTVKLSLFQLVATPEPHLFLYWESSEERDFLRLELSGSKGFNKTSMSDRPLSMMKTTFQ